MAAPTPLQAFSSIPKEPATPSIGQTDPQGESMTGAQALIRCLEDLGIDVVFGIPGGQILPVFDAITDETKFRFVLTRQEQAAGQAAQGYALATGRVGVCMVTSGPGATNMVTPIAEAAMDSVPLVVITGQVSVESIGTDAFQEADIMGITYPIVKHSYLVTDARDIPRVMTEAYYIAQTGRPGPVLIDLTKTAQTQQVAYSWPQKPILPGYKPTTKAHGHVLHDAAKLLSLSKRPLLYVGGGAARAQASSQVIRLSELTDAPVVTTLAARGVIPDSNPHSLGMPGMHGSISANGAIQECDLLVAIGARFDDRVTGKLRQFAPNAKVVHIDIDPAEIGKNRAVDVPIVGDVAQVLDDLCEVTQQTFARTNKPDLTAWWQRIHSWQTAYPRTYESSPTGQIEPQWALQELNQLVPKNAVWVTGVGQHQMWASQFIDFEHPLSWISSCGLGTMGYGLPAAIGAAVGTKNDRQVWLIEGDGGFQVSSSELAVARQEGLPLKIVIFNNSSYGMIRQWQHLFYSAHYSYTDLHDGTVTHQGQATINAMPPVPDFVKLAEAYDCLGLRANSKTEAVAAFTQALNTNDQPVVIDLRVWSDAQVWPMVPPGASNSEIIYKPGVTPLLTQDSREQSPE
ncbi:acetolactate synthase large subunit [Bombiscardovia coagulans]|uniref:Acetolactate synthase n=1 Tax=Bombiscardovia coagulans TaxID=686666 RepID=A0A261EVJ0_9BIFI|nr:acetolactate synthase large subunit [Bombiscardovia coagulans]OZG50666.1 acetolactate synthase 1 catalytic subunit [Bombiscardovia coagulans]